MPSHRFTVTFFLVPLSSLPGMVVEIEIGLPTMSPTPHAIPNGIEININSSAENAKQMVFKALYTIIYLFSWLPWTNSDEYLQASYLSHTLT